MISEPFERTVTAIEIYYNNKKQILFDPEVTGKDQYSVYLPDDSTSDCIPHTIAGSQTLIPHISDVKFCKYLNEHVFSLIVLAIATTKSYMLGKTPERLLVSYCVVNGKCKDIFNVEESSGEELLVKQVMRKVSSNEVDYGIISYFGIDNDTKSEGIIIELIHSQVATIFFIPVNYKNADAFYMTVSTTATHVMTASSNPKINTKTSQSTDSLAGLSFNDLYYKASEEDDVECQYRIGMMYCAGDGVDKDYFKGGMWLKKAAEKGHASSQNNLSTLYIRGSGVAKDYAQAVAWSRMAAKQGNVKAMTRLGLFYNKGEYVPIDNIKSYYWHKKAAELGSALSQRNLGDLYLHGHGVERDINEAVKWYEMGASQGDAIDQGRLADMYLYGDKIEKNIERSLFWFTESAKQGQKISMYYVGVFYDEGIGVEENTECALRWFSNSAEAGYPAAQFSLARLYNMGRGVLQDYEKSHYWVQKAANQKYAPAISLLASNYESGIGCEKDIKKSTVLYFEAAELGDADAQSAIAHYYKSRESLDGDYSKALYWYELAANNNSTYSQIELAKIHIEGLLNVKSNLSKGLAWLDMAIEQGSHSARGYKLELEEKYRKREADL